jgi:hypothetical protein
MSTSFGDNLNVLYVNSEKVQTRLNELAEEQVSILLSRGSGFIEPCYLLPNGGKQIWSLYGEILSQKYLEKRPNSKLMIDSRGFIITDISQQQLEEIALTRAKTWVDEHIDIIKECAIKNVTLGESETVISFPLLKSFLLVDLNELIDASIENVIKSLLDLRNVGVYRTETFDIRIGLNYTI